MTPRSLLATAVVSVLVAAVAALAAPRRYVVDGLSMAPGLMPGDVVSTGWWGGAGRLARPGRLETWVVEAPEARAAIKRVLGLPGEDVRIAAGDVVVDGRVILKPPPLLAELAVAVPLQPTLLDAGLELEPQAVFDDVPFAREVNRPLEAVADVGLAGVVENGARATRLVVEVDDLRVGWRLTADERFGVLAGRLDGHLVAVAWRLRDAGHDFTRGCLPAHVPDTWGVARTAPGPAAGPCLAPRLRLRWDPPARIAHVALWRDAHFRPVAGGTAAWTLGPDAYLVLGDFPTGSVDSRQWGPLPREALLRRVSPRR